MMYFLCFFIDLISGPVGISLEGSGPTRGAEIEMAEEEGLLITEEEETKMEDENDEVCAPASWEVYGLPFWQASRLWQF